MVVGPSFYGVYPVHSVTKFRLREELYGRAHRRMDRQRRNFGEQTIFEAISEGDLGMGRSFSCLKRNGRRPKFLRRLSRSLGYDAAFLRQDMVWFHNIDYANQRAAPSPSPMAVRPE